MDEWEVVCDESNNSPEDFEKGRINVDFHLKPPMISVTFIVNPDGSIEWPTPADDATAVKKSDL